MVSEEGTKEDGDGIESLRLERQAIMADKAMENSQNNDGDESGKDKFGDG